MFSLKVFLIFIVALFVILALEQVIPTTVVEVDFGFYHNFLPIKLIFVSIATISLVIQYLISCYVINSHQGKDNPTSISILVIQSIITILMTIVLFNVIENNRYQFLGEIASISYVTAVFFLGLTAFKFLRYFKMNRMNITSLLYGLGLSILTLNAVLQCISLNMLLGNFLMLSICYGFDAPQICYYVHLSLRITWIISFFLIWASSILLLYRSKTLPGKRFWIISSMPVVLLIGLIFPFIGLSLFDSLGIMTLFYILLASYLIGKFLTAYAFGTSIWSIRTSIDDTNKRDLVLIAGIGLFYYVLSINQTIYLPLEGFHPLSGVPYGIVTLSLAGLFAYMMSITRVDNIFLNKQNKILD